MLTQRILQQTVGMLATQPALLTSLHSVAAGLGSCRECPPIYHELYYIIQIKPLESSFCGERLNSCSGVSSVITRNACPKWFNV
jgi:hypothetical protein